MGDLLRETGGSYGVLLVGLLIGGLVGATWRPSHAQIAVGNQHTCALLEGGAVKCWGRNDPDEGQLGLGDTETRGDEPGEMGDSLAAVDLGSGRTATQIAAGEKHTCALLENGDLKCWGANGRGQLGLGDTASRGNEPDEMGDSLSTVDLGPGRSATQVVTGGLYTCALLEDGTVKCWGEGAGGKLGYEGFEDRGDESGEMGDALPTVDLGSGRKAKELTAGDGHVCAILDNDELKCWGFNSDGKLGLGDTEARGEEPGEMGDDLPAVDLGTGRTATQVSGGWDHTCALLDDGSVKCWGQNSAELGLGDTKSRGDEAGEMGDSLTAVNLGPDRTATQVATGQSLSCALLENGELKCWGFNAKGEVGLGHTKAIGDNSGEMGAALPAIDLGSGRTVTHIAAQFEHVCALLDNDAVKCWGNNNFGRLGLGDTEDRGDDSGEMGDNLAPVALGGKPLVVARPSAPLRDLPTRIRLQPNYPNPFNPITRIPFDLPVQAEVTLTVYDVLGRKVEILRTGPQPPGHHVVTFSGAGLPSGTYLYRLEAEGRVIATRPMMLLK